MLKGALNKGFVKYSIGVIILVVFAVFVLTFQPGSGSGAKHTEMLAPEEPGVQNSIQLTDFSEIETTSEGDATDSGHANANSQGKKSEGDPDDKNTDYPKSSGSVLTGSSSGGNPGTGVRCVNNCDKDGDGYKYLNCGGDDCDDSDPEVHPGAVEICDNGKDDDCDGAKDCEDSDCNGDSVCRTYCDPKSPGYWKNHLKEAENLLDCVHEDSVFDCIENQSDIEYVLDCNGDCSNMLNKLKKFLLATILNVCGGYFDLDDTFAGETIEYWIEHSIEEVENGESELDEYYKDALDKIVNGGIECYPGYHTECNEMQMCIVVEGEGETECANNIDCMQEECEPPYLEIGKEANPTELLCENSRITLTVTGKGEVCEQYYPIDVVLVFDRSGSMDDDGWDDNISDWQPIGDAKIAAKNFVDLLGKNDRAGLVSFATKANLDESLTFDHQDVKDEIDSMSAGGWTNMSNALELANEELVSNGRTDITWVEVLLSDGNNNCGMKNPPGDCHQRVFDRAEEAKDNGIIIYAIALGENANKTLMERIANITGGKFYYAPTSEDLEEIYEEVAESVTNIAGKDVVIYDYLPSYVELNGSLPDSCEYNESERVVVCELGTLSINETVTVSFDVYLRQLGYNLTNIYPDSGVYYTNHNGTREFIPFPETYVTVYGFEGAEEICNDTYDNDCDGFIDYNDSDCGECLVDEDCDDGLWCNGEERCIDYFCVDGTPPECDDDVECTIDSCDEENDRCVNEPDDSACNDGLWCNGQEYCDVNLGCVSGAPVDCSGNDIPGVGECTHSPDDNPYTWDYGEG
ncbi:hypothetical protein DRN98_07285, partial [Methanosarcinales archaeon]